MGNLRMNADQISYKGADRPMSVEEAIKNAGNTGLAHTADIAPDFSTETAYSAGDFVYHNGTLYVFTSNHAAGAWSTSDTQAVTVGGEITTILGGIDTLTGDVSNLNSNKANQITIAPFFNAEASYDPGDMVYYNGLSYRCVNSHEGAWDADDFAATTIASELDSLKSGLNNLKYLNNLTFSYSATDMQDYLGQVMDYVDSIFDVGLTINAIGVWSGTCTFILQVCRASSSHTLMYAIPQATNPLNLNKMWIAMKESGVYSYSTIDMTLVS